MDLAASHGVMHPSQTNYIASIAGELCNVTYDTPPPPLPQHTIVDLVEDAGRTRLIGRAGTSHLARAANELPAGSASGRSVL